MFKRLLVAMLAAALSAAGLVSLATPSAQAVGTTFYVSNVAGSNCSDSYATTSVTQPWCSVSKVPAERSPGDTILLGRGSSWDGQWMEYSGSGTATDPITIAAYGTGSKPKLSLKSLGKSTYANKAVIRLKNPSYWNVSGLELSYATAGVLAQYDKTFPGSISGNHDLRFSDLVVHHIAGIRQGVVEGDGTYYSAKCRFLHDTPNFSSETGLDLWMSGGVAVTGDFFDYPPAGSSFVDGVHISDIEGYHNTNTVNIDNCDAKVGEPNMPDDAHPELVRNVYVDNVWSRDGDGGEFTDLEHCNENMRFGGITGLVMTNSKIERGGACHVDTGTAGMILISVSHATFANNVFSDVPDTDSLDQTAVDSEIWNDHMNFYGNLMARNAGHALEFLGSRCYIEDYNTDHVVSGNTFFGSKGSLFRMIPTKPCDRPAFSADIFDNVYADHEFLNNPSLFYATGLFSNNRQVEEIPHYAADEFAGVQGAGGWTYQTTDDRTDPSHWTDATFDGDAHVMGTWTGGGNRGQISPFAQTGGTCGLCASARVWTAPRDGVVLLRSHVVANREGYNANVVVEKNGTTLRSATVLASDLEGDPLNVENLEVKAGDKLRFVVHTASPVAGDWVSWTPSIAYLPDTADSTNGELADGTFENTPVNVAPGQKVYLQPSGSKPWSYSLRNPGLSGAGLVGADVTAGAKSAFLEGVGSISQTVSGLRTGIRYRILFTAKKATTTSPTVQVVVDGKVVSTSTIGSTTATTFQTPSFTTTEGVHSVELRGTTAAATAYLDSVTFLTDASSVTTTGSESPVQSAGGYTYQPAATSEITWGSQTGVFRNGSTWSDYDVPRGQQGSFIQGQGGMVITNAAVPAGDYVVVFGAAQRGSDLGGQKLRVQVNSAPPNTITPTSERWGTYATAPVAVPGGSPVQLSFSGLTAGDHAAAIDDIRLVPVPGASASQSFETPVLGSPYFLYGATGAAGWSFQAEGQHGGSGLARNGQPLNVTASAGSQLAFVDSAAAIASPSGFLTPGQVYVLALDTMACLPGSWGEQQLRLYVDGRLVDTWKPSSSWQTQLAVVRVPVTDAGRVSIMGTNGTVRNGACVDNIRAVKL